MRPRHEGASDPVPTRPQSLENPLDRDADPGVSRSRSGAPGGDRSRCRRPRVPSGGRSAGTGRSRARGSGRRRAARRLARERLAGGGSRHDVLGSSAAPAGGLAGRPGPCPSIHQLLSIRQVAAGDTGDSPPAPATRRATGCVAAGRRRPGSSPCERPARRRGGRGPGRASAPAGPSSR